MELLRSRDPVVPFKPACEVPGIPRATAWRHLAPMHGMKHDHTFSVPLSPKLRALTEPAPAGAKGAVRLELRLVPA